MKQFISTDQSTFEKLRTQKALYIDKTKQIYNMLKTGECFFLSRPRRFGKSLLCSILAELFSGNRELFKGLWIDNSDWQWNKHPIIHFDMTDVAGQNRTAASVRERLVEILINKAAVHQLTLSQTGNPGDLLASFITGLHQKYNIGVAVIIDEYDKPVLDVDNSAVRNEIHKELASFYAPLKSKTAFIRLVFMTGVYKFSKTSIFSGLNNLIDLTFDPRTATLLGYTQDELESNFSNEIDLLAEKKQVSRSEMLITLREQYNGYHFGIELITGTLSPGVYNPFAMNHIFAANDLIEKWFESGSTSFLIQKIKEGNFVPVDAQGIEIDYGLIVRSCGPDNITLETLLYYTGYLTIAAYDTQLRFVKLAYPNKEVARAMSTELLKLFGQAGTQSAQARLVRSIRDCFRDNALEQLKELLDQSLAQFSYQIMLPYEQYFQTILYFLLDVGNLDVAAEVETNNTRMDIVIKMPNCIYIIEMKLNKPAHDGLEQILEKKYARRYIALGLPIIGVGVSIAMTGDDTHTGMAKRSISEVVWRKLQDF